MIYSLGLSIGLKMINRTEAQLGIQGFMQPLLEHQSKLSPSIRHNFRRHSMQIDLDIYISASCGPV
jgi:hypothetical protein